ncbi:MAG: DUF5050 domain-containing protein [Firmicutes bacterium]|nr:DUF5050 domain-containing protein [Bacillota bacterium]
MKKIIACLILISITLSGCNTINNEEKLEDSKQVYINNNVRGNSVGNIINGNGRVAKQDNYIYFTNEERNDWASDANLYKINSDGTDKAKLCDDSPSDINVVGNWVYYISGGNIYKIRLDGTNKTLLNEEYSDYLQVIGNWMYYIRRPEQGEDYNIYKMKIDGTEETKLNTDFSTDINVVGDSIYYINYSDNDRIYKIGTDGSQRALVHDESVFHMIVYEDWIYYYTMNMDVLYKVRVDGTQKKIVIDKPVTSYNIKDDWIYYSTPKEEDKFQRDYIYKQKIGENSSVELGMGSVLSIVDDWIYYYYDQGEAMQLFRMKTDRTQNEQVYQDE